MLKNTFLYQVVLHELKKQPFSANQKFSVCRKLYALPSKASRFRNQNTAHSNNFLLSSKTAFLCAKSLLFAQVFPCWFQKTPIFTNQKSCFYPNFFLFPPKTFFFCPLPIPTALNLLSAKISHFYKPKAFYSHKPFLLPPKANLFCPPLPISTSLNLLFAKNTAVLLLFALILCCKAGKSHRFKSLPAILGKMQFSA